MVHVLGLVINPPQKATVPPEPSPFGPALSDRFLLAQSIWRSFQIIWDHLGSYGALVLPTPNPTLTITLDDRSLHSRGKDEGPPGPSPFAVVLFRRKKDDPYDPPCD